MSTSVESIESGTSSEAPQHEEEPLELSSPVNATLDFIGDLSDCDDENGDGDTALLEDNETARVDAKNLLECLGDRAGMDGVDRERVKQIVHEASIGSKFYENEQRKAKQLQDSISSLLKKTKFYRNETTADFRARHKKTASAILQHLLSDYQTPESTIWQGSCYCHMDMDMFYCAVEQLENPSLKEVPMAVGGSGMICTANYEARKYGIRAGMPGFIGLQLCPKLQLVRPHFPKYAAKSEKFREIIAMYDSNYLSKSCDEVSMNLTPLVEGKSLEFVDDLVREIREKVRQNTGGLTCSAGVGLTSIIAKMNSNVNKPNGQFVLHPWQTLERLQKLECRKVPGIGKARATTFEALQIRTLGDVWENADVILYIYPEVTATNILRLCTGHHVEMDRERKSSGCEKSFQPSGDLTHLREMLRHISEKVQSDLERLNCVCGRITLKVKDEFFKSATLSSPLPMLTDKADLIYSVAHSLFKKFWTQAFKPGMKLRLLGIISTSLKPKRHSTQIKSIRDFFVAQKEESGRSNEAQREVQLETNQASCALPRERFKAEERSPTVLHVPCDRSFPPPSDASHGPEPRSVTTETQVLELAQLCSQSSTAGAESDQANNSPEGEGKGTHDVTKGKKKTAAEATVKGDSSGYRQIKLDKWPKKRASAARRELAPTKVRTLRDWIHRRVESQKETIDISD